MKKTKIEKGITLVALIITIVVLLILAVVSINSIVNDGIIGKAEGSADKFNGAQGNEQGILGGYEDELNKYYGSNSGDELTEEELEEIDLMEKYVLGAEKTGRSGLEIVNIDMSTLQIISFIDDPESIIDASITVTVVSQAENVTATKGIAYVKYNNTAYKIVLDMATFFTESVEKISKSGREGQTVQYDSNNDGTTEEWVIITDRNGKVEIVSKNVVGSLSLGSEDTSVTVTTDLDGNGIVGDNNDKAIASYNNAITTINNYCKSLVTATNNDGVRSVGGTNNSYTPYHSTDYDNWGSKITVDVAATDESYISDYEKMAALGIVATGEDYWIASRRVFDNSKFAVGFGRQDGYLFYYYLWDVNSSGAVSYYEPSCGVRPVVINPAGI